MRVGAGCSIRVIARRPKADEAISAKRACASEERLLRFARNDNVSVYSPITLSMVIGRSRTRLPVAWNTALAIAAAVPTMPISPTALTPVLHDNAAARECFAATAITLVA